MLVFMIMPEGEIPKTKEALTPQERVSISNDFSYVVADVLKRDQDDKTQKALAEFVGIFPDDQIRGSNVLIVESKVGGEIVEIKCSYEGEAGIAYMAKDGYYFLGKVLDYSSSDKVRHAVIANSDCIQIPEVSQLVDALAQSDLTDQSTQFSKESRSIESQNPELFYPSKDLGYLVIDLLQRFPGSITLDSALELANIISVPEIRRVVNAYISEVLNEEISPEKMKELNSRRIEYPSSIIYPDKDLAYNATENRLSGLPFQIPEIARVVNEIVRSK